MNDAADRLIAAWFAWERAPRSEITVRRKFRALEALGIGSIEAHEHIAACRHAGMSIPDAVQTLINDRRS